MRAARDDRRDGPSYHQIAATLTAEINAGGWRVGDKLPTEAELVERFGVSRGTIRSALRELHDFGYLSKRRGTRSVVVRTEEHGGFVNSAQSLDELLEYARFSRNTVLSSEMILLGEQQAAQLDCEPGSEWLRIQVLRSRAEGAIPFSYADIHVASRYRVIADVYDGSTPVYAAMEAHLGISVFRVTQLIEVVVANENVAQRLQVPAGSPTLCTKSFFYTNDGELAEIGVAYFATGRYRMRIALDRKRGPAN